MLKYGGIDVSEGIDVTKTNGSWEHIIFLYWHFGQINFRYDPKVYIVAIAPLKEMFVEFIFCI